MRKNSWFVVRAAAAAAVVAAWGLPSTAQTVQDKAAILDGDWSDPNIWDDLGFPPPKEPDNSAVGDLEAYNAIIAGGRIVTITQAGETAIRVDAGTGSEGNIGTLNINAGDLTISNPENVGAALPSFRVGVTPGSVGIVNMTGGSVTISGLPNSGFANGDLMVGDQGTGTLNLSGGTITASDEVLIGTIGGSNGTVTVSGNGVLQTNIAAGSTARGILVGVEAGGTGRLNIRDNAVVNSRANLDIGRRRNNVTNVRSTGFVDMTGGTVNVGTASTAGADFTVGFESDGRFDISGASPGAVSTVNITDNLVIGITAATAPSPGASGVVNQGANSVINVDEILVGENGVGVYNMTGGTINGRNTLQVAQLAPSTGTFNQSGGIVNVPRLDAGQRGTGAYNMNGGTLNVGTTAAGNLRVGQDGGGANVGIGTFNLTAGTVNVGSGTLASHIFLGDFDNSNGTFKVSGGTLNVSGNVNVGAALASNAPSDANRLEPSAANGAQGQALDARGIFIVSGNAGTINVNGDFLANPADKGDFREGPGRDNFATLGFEIFNAGGTSLINVASAADLDGAVVDMTLMGGYTPAPDTVFNLMSAAEGIGGPTGTGTTKVNGSTGEAFSLAAGDATDWTLRVVPGATAGAELLQAIFQATNVARTLYWDIDGAAAPGAGGAAPAGNWNGTTANFNTDAAGGAAGTTAALTTDLDTAVFAAGTDGGGAYTVNLSGTQSVAEVRVARGSVTLAGGTLNTGAFDVASGATGTVTSAVTGGAAGAVVKTGAGTLTLSTANTYAGGTAVQAGTLALGNANALGTGGLTVANGATVRALPGLPVAVDLPSQPVLTASGATGGTLDITDNAAVVRYANQAAAFTGHAAINGAVRNAFHDFAWDQPGVTSSTVAADIAAGVPSAVGILLNNDGGGNALFYGNGTDLPQFEGRSVNSNSVLTKYTLLGDGDLNGTVDSVDFALFQAGYTGAAPYVGFAFGDYDYNGVVDSVDFGLFQAGYQYSQGNPTPAMVAFAGEHHLSLVAAAVPEPTTLGLLALAGGGLLTRRRRGGRRGR